MTRRRGASGFLCALTVMAWFGWGARALASSGIESPDTGIVQLGRGGAWLARADDPLAVYFSPSAMAFQATGIHVGSHFMFQGRCFMRVGTGGQPISPLAGVPGPGTPPSADTGTPPPASVCSDSSAFMNPQIAATFRLGDRLAIGLSVIAPHADGNNTWPESLPYINSRGVPSTQPAPQRYLLTKLDAKIVSPTVSIAYAPTDDLAFGIGFIWGVASLDIVNFAQMTSVRPDGGPPIDHAEGDLRAHLQARDFFVPGFVVSALWAPAKNLDVAGWVKWQDAIRATTALRLEALYWTRAGLPNTNPCAGNPLGAQCNITTAPGTLKLPIPMEAKLGLRYHHRRADSETNSPVPFQRRVRDPLSDDSFDIEVDFTWANNSAIDNVEVRFPPGIRVNEGSSGGLGEIPVNADVPHRFRDVAGIRIGGDFVAIRSRLALRAGAFHEFKGQDDAYLNLDFDAAERTGLSTGGTLRFGAVDISAGYQHTFYGALNNHGRGLVFALSGDASGTSPGAGMQPARCGPNPQHPRYGPGCFRSFQPVNGGSLRESLDEFGLSATVRF